MYSVLYVWQHKKFTSSFLEKGDDSFWKEEATVHMYGLPINFSKANGFFTSSPFLPQSLSLFSFIHSSFAERCSHSPLSSRRRLFLYSLSTRDPPLPFIQSERMSFFSSQTTMPVTMRNACKQAISFSILKDILLPLRNQTPAATALLTKYIWWARLKADILLFPNTNWRLQS